jgi:hypothetical protein
VKRWEVGKVREYCVGVCEGQVVHFCVRSVKEY